MSRLVTLSHLGFATNPTVKNWYFKNNLPHTVKLFSRRYPTDTNLRFEFSINSGDIKMHPANNLVPGDQILAYIATPSSVKGENELALPPYVLQPTRTYIVLGAIESSGVNDVTVRAHDHTVTPFLHIQNNYFLPVNVYENKKLVAVLGRNQPNEKDSSVILRGDHGIPRGVQYDFEDQLTQKVFGKFVTESAYIRTINVGVIFGYVTDNFEN